MIALNIFPRPDQDGIAFEVIVDREGFMAIERAMPGAFERAIAPHTPMSPKLRLLADFVAMLEREGVQMTVKTGAEPVTPPAASGGGALVAAGLTGWDAVDAYLGAKK